MTDRATREAERLAAAGVHDPGLLRKRIRSGKRPANLRCICDRPEAPRTDENRSAVQAMLACCDGSGLRPYADGVALAAYLGDEAARELLPQGQPGLRGFEPSWAWLDNKATLKLWLSGLASRWPEAMLRAALAVGREAQRRHFCGEPVALIRAAPSLQCTGKRCTIRRALTAAQAYLDNPTPENREACRRIYLAGTHPPHPWNVLCGVACGLVAESTPRLTVQEFELTDETKRRVIREALVPWALEVA